MKKGNNPARAALFELQIRLGLTQTELGKETGVSLPTITRARAGDISAKMAYKLYLLAKKHRHHDLAQRFHEYVLGYFGE